MWGRTVVTKVLDEMVFARPEEFSEKYAEWVGTDSNSLAPEGTHVKERQMPKDLGSSDDSPIKQDSDDAD